MRRALVLRLERVAAAPAGDLPHGLWSWGDGPASSRARELRAPRERKMFDLVLLLILINLLLHVFVWLTSD
jgi:hypothetical protein